jgi:hypothetical protein
MVDVTISRVRLRDLARLGRFQGWEARRAASQPCALRRAASSRPGTDDLVASTI